MLRLDIIGPSFAISVFLLFYYIAVGLFVVFFATIFGYSLAKANGLGNWYWSVQTIALIVTGLLSDWLKVRKPFMVVGGLDQRGRRRPVRASRPRTRTRRTTTSSASSC